MQKINQILQKNIGLLNESGDVFGKVYNEWRLKRARKLLSIYGIDWFKNKTILEMGCGFGNLGLFFKQLGAKVDFSDARPEVLDVVKNKSPDSSVFVIDQESDWVLNKKYDLIIHFGLLYNLNYWERDLNKALSFCDNLALETAVTRYDNDLEFKILCFRYTQELYGPFRHIGTLTSRKNIENVFIKNNFSFERYDDEDLNIEKNVIYDWREEPLNLQIKMGMLKSWWDNPHNVNGKRRFWICRAEKNA